MTFRYLDDVLAEVAPFGRIFTDAGHRLFLVGGIVRDQWLDTPLGSSSDIDMTTDARPDEIKRLVAPLADDLWSQGEKFGTIGMRSNGRDYEITTHRAESYVSESRKPSVSFGDDIELDLARRDFTVNAMAIELPNGEVVDPFGGVADLEAGRLRTPLSPEISFSDDPLRMLRAARFASKYDLAVDDELCTSASLLRERLRIVAIERIGTEMHRLLDLDHPLTGLRFLADTGLMLEVLGYGRPELSAGIESGVDRAITVAAHLPPEWRLRLAGIGLVVFGDPAGVQQMCRRLRLSREDERWVTALATAATDALALTDHRPPTMRRWVGAHGSRQPAAGRPDVVLARALSSAEQVAPFIDALDGLLETEDDSSRRVLDGGTIMTVLGTEAGPIVGEAVTYLREQYVEHGPMTESEQIAALRAWRTPPPN